MPRVRRREARTLTADRDWERRRSEVLSMFGDTLEQYEDFWSREPDIPASLRRRIVGYVALQGGVFASDPAAYIAHLEARRRWLRANGLPAGSRPLTSWRP